MNTIICIVFVFLVITTVWMILYCCFLKSRLTETEKDLRYQANELQETKRLLRSLADLCGYDLPNNARWLKKGI